MFQQNRDTFTNSEDGFSRPVESIMKCEDFKSNFARKLSNRYISRSSQSPKQDQSKRMDCEAPKKVPERIEPHPQLSPCIVEPKEPPKPTDRTTSKADDIRRIEKTVLNMEVETLKWQLVQTEANRQMHIALIKQIVSFLSRVREHIEIKSIDRANANSHYKLQRSFNSVDLLRSKSVFHVNNIEYTPNKRSNVRKISKSSSNVCGFKDLNASWNHSKLSLVSETEQTHKITEEISRLITLANTVLSTKIPDLNNLNCCCTDMYEKQNKSDEVKTENRKSSTLHLNSIQEDCTDNNILNNDIDKNNSFTESNIENETLEIHNLPENAFVKVKEHSPDVNENIANVERRIDFSASSFIEDESGFSSMSSFQDIGIPIISVIPPSPCKEDYIEELPDIQDDSEKWKTDAVELDKQAVKVFWV